MIRMLMCSPVMQEEEGKPFCGLQGLAEGEEGKGMQEGKEGIKEGRCS